MLRRKSVKIYDAVINFKYIPNIRPKMFKEKAKQFKDKERVDSPDEQTKMKKKVTLLTE